MRKNTGKVENMGDFVEKIVDIFLDLLLGKSREGKERPWIYSSCSGKWFTFVVGYNCKRLGLIAVAVGALFFLFYPSGLESLASGIMIGMLFSLSVAWLEYLRAA